MSPDFVADPRYESGAIAVSEPGPSGSAVPFWALMGLTFVLVIAPQAMFPVLAPLRIALLTAVAAMVAYLLDRLTHRQPIVRFTREMRIIGCLVGWAILTVPLSYWPGGSVSVLLDLYFKTLAVFWLVGHVVNTLTKLRRIVWGLALMGVPLAGTAVRHFLSGLFVQGKRIFGYEAPLTLNPNDLALMLNLILALTVALFLLTRNPAARAGLLVVILLDAIGVIITFSRAGFLTLVTIFAMYLWKLRKQPERRWAWVVLALALMGTPFLPSGYSDRLATISDINSDPTGSAQERWNDTVAAVRFVLRNPIVGAGVGQNVLALNEERGPTWKFVHNVYLAYAVDLGLPGLVMFLLLLVGSIKSVRSVQQRSARVPALRELFHLAAGIEISLVAFAVAGMFHPEGYNFYFYYFAGLALAAKSVYGVEANSS